MKELQKYLKSLGLYTGKIDGVFGPLTAKALQELRTKSKESNLDLLPLNVASLVKHLNNNQIPITEKNLSNKELTALREIVRKNLSEGKTKITYRDYGVERVPNITGQYSQAAMEHNKHLKKLSTKEKLTDPYYLLQTTLGAAEIVTTPQDTFVIDTYDFNDAKDDGFKESLKIAIDRAKGHRSLYGIFRSIGSGFGTEEGNPVIIRTNQQQESLNSNSKTLPINQIQQDNSKVETILPNQAIRNSGRYNSKAKYGFYYNNPYDIAGKAIEVPLNTTAGYAQGLILGQGLGLDNQGQKNLGAMSAFNTGIGSMASLIQTVRRSKEERQRMANQFANEYYKVPYDRYSYQSNLNDPYQPNAFKNGGQYQSGGIKIGNTYADVMEETYLGSNLPEFTVVANRKGSDKADEIRLMEYMQNQQDEKSVYKIWKDAGSPEMREKNSMFAGSYGDEYMEVPTAGKYERHGIQGVLNYRARKAGTKNIKDPTLNIFLAEIPHAIQHNEKTGVGERARKERKKYGDKTYYTKGTVEHEAHSIIEPLIRQRYQNEPNDSKVQYFQANGGMPVSPQGQYKYPGRSVRVPASHITMKGVNYPVHGISNRGQSVIMQPNRDYYFEGADYVDEYPMMKTGGIHIKKENRGKFTAAAKRAGMGVQEYASKILNDPNATPLQKKRANFARNAKKWKHQDGGEVSYYDTPGEDVIFDATEVSNVQGYQESQGSYEPMQEEEFDYSNFTPKPFFQQMKGGTIAVTHNNPGNIKFGNFAKSFGATQGKPGRDGGTFAIFPDVETGLRAQRELLTSKNYRNLTVDAAMKRWSNNGYGAEIFPEIATKKMGELTESELRELQKRQIKREDVNMYKQLFQ